MRAAALSSALALALAATVAMAGAFGGTSSGVDLTGVCGVNMSCTVSNLTSASTVQSNAASGTYAFKASVNGSKLGVGTGQAYFDAPDADTIRTFGTLKTGGGVDMYNAGVTDSFRGVVMVLNVGGLQLVPLSAPWTCAASSSISPQKVATGTLSVITGSTGKPHRLCLCTYDGTAYKWLNLATAAFGDATTCPEYP